MNEERSALHLQHSFIEKIARVLEKRDVIYCHKFEQPVCLIITSTATDSQFNCYYVQLDRSVLIETGHVCVCMGAVGCRKNIVCNLDLAVTFLYVIYDKWTHALF